MARAARVSTADAVRRFTIRRGSILKFRADGGCSLLEGARCGVHEGRPLACRLYPLGLERDGAADRFIALEPAAGSLGVYGEGATIEDFLAAQQTEPYIEAVARYAGLLPIFRARIAALVDFDRVEPREFWRCARREALAESGYDPNPLIDALFDADRFRSEPGSSDNIVESRALRKLIEKTTDASALAAAAVMLAVSLGYSPDDARS
jgi:Fe-S-cluster containining protein